MNPLPAVRPKVQVRFFAVLREQAGCPAVELETAAETPAALYAELQARFPGLTLPFAVLRVSRNERYAEPAERLQPGDRVVFIPPVAGG